MEQSVDETELRRAATGGDPDALLALGDHLLYTNGDLDEAEAAYEQVEQAGDIRGTLKLGALHEDFRKDQVSAGAAWRRADEAGSLNGAGNLGRLLREQGDMRGAEAAFRRCVDRGSQRAAGDWAALLFQRDDAPRDEVAEAISLLCHAHDRFIWHDELDVMVHTMLLDGMEQSCDPEAIEAGTRQADEEGSASGAWHLAWHLKGQGRLSEAIAAFRRAAERKHDDAWMRGAGTYFEMGDAAAAEAMAREGDQVGAATASAILGAILDERGAREEAFEAYKRADERGAGEGSFSLAVDLIGRGDLAAAEEAFLRAQERGVERAEEALRRLRQLRTD